MPISFNLKEISEKIQIWIKQKAIEIQGYIPISYKVMVAYGLKHI